jgi:SAM-dependent methyltransferase
MELRENKPCVLCGGDQVEVVYRYPPDYYDHARFETAGWDGRQSLDLQIVRCVRCDLWFSRPSFRAESLSYVYPEDVVAARTRFEDELRKSRGKHTRMLARIQERLSSGVVWDIGSRYGVLPYLACAAGYAATGVEYNAASVRVAQRAGAPVVQGALEDVPRLVATQGIGHVDAFVLDDVVEHLVNPKLGLATLASVQKPGGLLFLQQMDRDSLGHRIARRHWYYVSPAGHMYYFDEKTLRALLDAVGYDVLSITRPNPLVNLRRTVTRTWPGAVAKILRSKLPGAGKASYLTRRLRSADDMFFVVAVKR